MWNVHLVSHVQHLQQDVTLAENHIQPLLSWDILLGDQVAIVCSHVACAIEEGLGRLRVGWIENSTDTPNDWDGSRLPPTSIVEAIDRRAPMVAPEEAPEPFLRVVLSIFLSPTTLGIPIIIISKAQGFAYSCNNNNKQQYNVKHKAKTGDIKQEINNLNKY